MHPKSPRQDKPTPWTETAVVCISSKYSRFAIFAIGALYIIASLTLPAGKNQPVHDAAEMKRLMKRQDEDNEVAVVVSESSDTREERDHLRSTLSEDSTFAGATSDISTYLPLLHPVLNPTTADKDHPVNIRFLMGLKENSQSEFLVEGMERSEYLKLVTMSRYNQNDIITYQTNKYDSNHPTIWLADVESMDMNCHLLQGLVQHLAQESKENMPTALVLMDYSGSSERLYCPDIEQIIPRERIRITKRNIVTNRYWNTEESWVNVGNVAPNDGNNISGGPILFAPFMVRDAFVEGLDIAIQRANHTKITCPVDLKRERDVAHFWTINDYSHYSFLRDKVGSIVESLTGEKSNGREIHTVVKALGEVEEIEMNKISYAYVEQMVRTKVVVVAQRDEWEGHHRLLEALASGAMVIADKTLALPTGLKDGESLVLYDSAQSLKDAILYYLNPRNDKERIAIARKGWEIVLGRHRSWHRVEEVIFGEPLTQVDRPFDSAPTKRKRRFQKQNIAIY